MKALPAGLQDHLDTGATTLCWCWKLVTIEGEKFGFTNHDNDLEFDNLIFQAASGFNGSQIETNLGLSVDNLEVDGALSSDKLSEADLFAGVFDNALVEIWQVNWRDTSQALLLRKGNLGEVSRSDVGFSAEIRGLTHQLNQPQGRLFQFGCDAKLGDSKCRVDLNNTLISHTATVSSIRDATVIIVTGLDYFDDGWFSSGRLKFTSGTNISRASEIKNHRVTAAGVQLELWQEMPRPVSAGDQFSLTAGCDKSFQTCKNKFSNAVNFQGFPHMPGNDFVAFYPNGDDAQNDGGPIV